MQIFRWRSQDSQPGNAYDGFLLFPPIPFANISFFLRPSPLLCTVQYRLALLLNGGISYASKSSVLSTRLRTKLEALALAFFQ